jgi:hypothetical protein
VRIEEPGLGQLALSGPGSDPLYFLDSGYPTGVQGVTGSLVLTVTEFEGELQGMVELRTWEHPGGDRWGGWSGPTGAVYPPTTEP